MMDFEAYVNAFKQRRALRQQINNRLVELREAAHSLQAAAGNISDGRSTLVAGPDPLAQVSPLVGEAAQLSAQLQRNAEQVAALQSDLTDAQAKARAALMRTVGIGVVLLAGLVVYLFFKH
jgi:hypothetical protein